MLNRQHGSEPTTPAGSLEDSSSGEPAQWCTHSTAAARRTHLTSSGRSGPGGNGRWLRQHGVVGRRPIWLLAPAGVLLVLLLVVPLAIASYTSFLNLSLQTLHEWLLAPFIGLRNYIDGFDGNGLLGPTLLRSAWTSISFSCLTTLITLPLGVTAALSVNTRFRGRPAIRGLYLIPYIIPGFVTAFVARIAFLNHTGIVDVVMSALHLGGRNTYWLLGPRSFWAMLMVEIWSTWPFMYLMTLAGLQSISLELYDASETDGASSWQKVRYVILPQLRRVLGLAILLATIFHFNNFTLPFVMFGTTPPASVEVLPLNIYISSFNLFQFGLGAAMSVITMLIMIIPGVLYLRSLRLTEPGS